MATERVFKSLRVLVMFSNDVWLGSVLVLEQHYCVLFSTAVSFCPILINSIKSEMHSAPPPALQDPGPTIHSVIVKMGAKLFPVLPFPQDVSSLRL